MVMRKKRVMMKEKMKIIHTQDIKKKMKIMIKRETLTLDMKKKRQILITKQGKNHKVQVITTDTLMKIQKKRKKKETCSPKHMNTTISIRNLQMTLVKTKSISNIKSIIKKRKKSITYLFNNSNTTPLMMNSMLNSKSNNKNSNIQFIHKSLHRKETANTVNFTTKITIANQ